MSLEHLWREDGFPGGTYFPDDGYGPTLVDGLAAGLDIRLEQGVTHVTTTDSGVSIQTWTDTYVVADAIVTVPLGVLKDGAIAFDPPLSQAKQDAIGRMQMAGLEKVVLTFDDHWWAGHFESGSYYLSETYGELPLWVDLTDDTGVPTIVGLYGGQNSLDQQLVPDQDKVDRALEVLTEMTGLVAPVPTDTAVSAWRTDPFAGGSYSAVALGSGPDDYAELGKTEGEHVFFAGEHTAFDHYGTVNGAMLSGMRVAEELGGDPTVLPGQ
jgi:monoamine oxidase